MSEACAMTALYLRRIDPARNMHRFYRLDIQPDLFGRVLLMKQWGRVGTQGRIRLCLYAVFRDISITIIDEGRQARTLYGIAVLFCRCNLSI